MPEIRFHEDDGPLRISLANHEAVIRGEGEITYYPRHRAASITQSVVQRAKWVRYVERAALVASIVSAVVSLIFLIWGWASGTSTPSFVSISAKLFSVALLGSLFSLGGINLFSLKSQLGAASSQLAEVRRGCPFMPLFTGDSEELQRPGNPSVCVKCPLGVDRSSNRDDRLIHHCDAYPELHRRWLEIPGAHQYV